MKQKTGRKLLSVLLTLAMVVGLVPGMNLTALAYDGDPYASLVNTTTKVTFNSKPWYIIADDSTAADAGTVTLLAADTSFGTSAFSKNDSNVYSSSIVKSKLDALTAEGGAFASVKDAIVDTNLSDVGVTGAKLYLLSTSEAGPYANFDFTGVNQGVWWLRSPGIYSHWAAIVMGESGYGEVYADGRYVENEYGVRPALKLNLPSVVFSSVNLSGGANATVSGGSAIQNYFDYGSTRSAMTTVTYTANSGYEFPETSNLYKTTNGITVTRTSETIVTVSGTPTVANVSIAVPDAVSTHTHSFTYSASGETITAKCDADGCDLTGGEATLT